MIPSVKPELVHSAFKLIQSGLANSRADLKKQLSISASTASNITKILLQKDLISEVGLSASTGGRPASRFKATQSSANIAVGELGTNHAFLGITDQVGNVVAATEIQIQITNGPEVIVKQLANAWRKLLKDVPYSEDGFAGCGLALPGPVNEIEQIVVAPARMPNWHNAPVARMLEKELNCPAFVDNDARAAALGEVGTPNHEYDNFIYVKTGSGIGACCVIDGKPYSGSSGLAGDITHTFSYPLTDITCACGRIGCLETVASGQSIRRTLAEQGLDLPDMRAVITTAEQADPKVTFALRNAGQRLGEALAPLINFLNPQAIILGGSLSEVSIFKASVRAAIYNSCIYLTSEKLEVVPSLHRRYSALYGLDRKLRNHLATLPANIPGLDLL